MDDDQNQCINKSAFLSRGFATYKTVLGNRKIDRKPLTHYWSRSGMHNNDTLRAAVNNLA